MKRLTKSILASIFLWTTVCGILALDYGLTFAAIPHLINYQGRLTEKDSGKPVKDGTYPMVFRLFDAEAQGQGTLLWQGTYQVTVTKGLFNVLLGSTSDPSYDFSKLAFDKPYYLEVLFNSEVFGQRQPITAAGYAVRAEKAEDAGNSTTVANTGVSTTPAPNKILPLDSSAKLPVSALKVYDSGWFAASGNATYTKNHNLGTTKVQITIMASTNADGSGHTTLVGNWWWDPNITSYNTTMTALSTTQITVKTQDNGIGKSHDVDITSGYLRIVMLALE